ncbi:hypothetical protein [Deinococcus pimensis]|uniref:hypothetical protein n=1 Tax=Deinococcus pimensis TaxID=309888 RepID=UPI0004AC8929|nr:hypothetical protein [Deinococcus pimensis]
MTAPGDRPTIPEPGTPPSNPDTPDMPGNLPERLPPQDTPVPIMDPPTNPDTPGIPEVPPLGDPLPSPA